MDINRVGTFTLGWGESLVWDGARDRLYFVDCAANALHWLDGSSTEPETLPMPSLATCVVPTEDGSLIAVLDDGLHLVNPDSGAIELISVYPDALGGRCNDACADLDGNIITGKLNLEPLGGSSWQFSRAGEWTLGALTDRRSTRTAGCGAHSSSGAARSFALPPTASTGRLLCRV